MKRSSRRGFTLIELLVVIAIIAILAAILFPVFAKAREKARQTACMNNMKQLGIGFKMYMDNYDDTYPGSGCAGQPVWGWIYSPTSYSIDVTKGSIYPYVKTKAAYFCPSDTEVEQDAMHSVTELSYSMNENFMNAGGIADSGPVTESDVSDPSETIMLMEEDSTSVGGQGLNDGCFYPSNQNDYTATRHSGGGTFVMADTHAKWYRAVDVLSKSPQGKVTVGRNYYFFFLDDKDRAANQKKYGG